MSLTGHSFRLVFKNNYNGNCWNMASTSGTTWLFISFYSLPELQQKKVTQTHFSFKKISIHLADVTFTNNKNMIHSQTIGTFVWLYNLRRKCLQSHSFGFDLKGWITYIETNKKKNCSSFAYNKDLKRYLIVKRYCMYSIALHWCTVNAINKNKIQTKHSFTYFFFPP